MRIANSLWVIGIGILFTGVVQSQERGPFEVGVSFAHISSEFGRATTTLQRTDGVYTLSRPTAGSFDDATLALDVSYRVNNWLSFSLLTTGAAEKSASEQWTPDPPFPPAAPGGLPVPTTVSLEAKSEVRSYVVAATLEHAIAGATSGYIQFGAAFVQSGLTLFDNQGAVFDRLDADDTRPWFAFGARHRFDSGLTMNAEAGSATGGHRVLRVGIGWAF